MKKNERNDLDLDISAESYYKDQTKPNYNNNKNEVISNIRDAMEEACSEDILMEQFPDEQKDQSNLFLEDLDDIANLSFGKGFSELDISLTQNK